MIAKEVVKTGAYFVTECESECTKAFLGSYEWLLPWGYINKSLYFSDLAPGCLSQ